MRYLLLFSIFILTCSCSSSKKEHEHWLQLFNGTDLSNWDIKIAGSSLNENYKNTFKVENGILIVDYSEYDSFNNLFGHLITKAEYSCYKLRAEYRIVGEQLEGAPVWAYRNNGLMLHCQSAGSMDFDQYFPTSVEVQLYGAVGDDDRTNMNVCTPGTLVDINEQPYYYHCCNSNSNVINGEDWTTVEVEVYGDSLIRHLIDGEVVLEYTNIRLDPDDTGYSKLFSANNGDKLSKGHIAIQSESHRTEFRKMELLDLSDQYCH